MSRRPPSFLRRTAIAGVGYSSISRRSGTSVLELASSAVRAAVADCGLDLHAVNGVLSFRMMEDSVPASAVATALALPDSRVLMDVALGGSAPSMLVAHAAMIVDAGVADHVVVFRALNGRSGQRVGTARVPGPATAFRYPLGLTAYPQFIAMWARRFMAETGASADDLAAVPIAQRSWAADNERALVREPLTIDEYFASPMISDPFRLADCTIEADGACAVVVTSLERARSLARPPVVLQSAAYLARRGAGLDQGDAIAWEDCSRNYTSYLAPDLWAWAEMGPRDVDVAELYDCFSSSVLFALEGLGITARGGSGQFVRSGATTRGGSLPVNTNGGLLCEGYLHGMNTVAEAVMQLQGRGGARQVAGAQTAVVTSGALTDGSALVLSVDR